ncbi:polyketide cyclase/dehydrase/lipid transport protein [Streptomyces sp. 2132.2]|uniref:SRPBCC family protein n=1 Tax=Streptomyces sp. 2132.2 TaxID=2485161 RepID=UPI000F4670CF|nr:SRPBCC family protein [Streptomyces sp. 2132.2]ROR00205.1 polyketide cyclase/dehydrase/lipid transport protein [Streptomyces sp. 2132.2]
MNRRTLSATLTLPLPPEAAFRLFTARGERDWVPGWEPVFPVETPDDTAPGTVWLTASSEEETTWLVASRDFPRSVSYARITPGVRAGTVTVTLAATEAGSEVTVTYDMTPLTPAAAEALDEFAAEYPAFIRSWEELIAARLA